MSESKEEELTILATAGYDHTIRFWEALSGLCSRTLQHPESQVNALSISPCKRFLAAAGRHSIKLYDIRSSNPNSITTFTGHTGNITAVQFHAESKWLASSSEDGSVKVWDVRSGGVQRDYQLGNPVEDVAIHPNQGEIVAGTRSGEVRIYDLGKGEGQEGLTHTIVPEAGVAVQSVSVSSDGGILVAGSVTGNVYIWRIIPADVGEDTQETNLAACRAWRAHREYLTKVLLSPDGRLLATCSADHTVKIWKIDIEEPSLEILDDDDVPMPPESPFGPDGRLNTAGLLPGDTAVSSQTPTSGRSSRTDKSRSESPDSSSSVVASQPSLRRLQILHSRRPLPILTTLETHQRWVWDCAFSADSAYLVSVCSDHYARLWDLQTSAIIRQYSGHHRGVVCVALNDFSSAP